MSFRGCPAAEAGVYCRDVVPPESFCSSRCPCSSFHSFIVNRNGTNGRRDSSSLSLSFLILLLMDAPLQLRLWLDRSLLSLFTCCIRFVLQDLLIDLHTIRDVAHTGSLPSLLRRGGNSVMDGGFRASAGGARPAYHVLCALVRRQLLDHDHGSALLHPCPAAALHISNDGQELSKRTTRSQDRNPSPSSATLVATRMLKLPLRNSATMRS